MTRLFGTDGVRGVANRDLTPDIALLLGRAAGSLIASEGRGTFVLGRDTRLSGPMLEGALIAGLTSAGVDVLRMGVVPTPAVAFLTVHHHADGGSMISASHNPVPDNGIKFFDANGVKITGEVEARIEAILEGNPSSLPIGEGVGSVEDHLRSLDAYVEHLLGTVHGSLQGVRVVLDLAHGAAAGIAPEVFRRLGADVIPMNDDGDGARINVGCGSTDLSGVAGRVIEEGATLGLGFDGDADRVLAVDEKGVVVDGDQIVGMFALRLYDEGLLKNETVVATVMANLGFTRALRERGIHVVQAPVGDRYVMEAMVSSGAILGGEQSGHVIFAEHATTGDGILTGLQLASMIAASDVPLSRAAHVFERVPQVLLNVAVSRKDDLDSTEGLWEEVRTIEDELGDEGRVLLRASGTEPLVRVMVEALDPRRAEEAARRLADAVTRELT